MGLFPVASDKVKMTRHTPRGTPAGNLAYGLNKGRKVTPCPKQERPSRKKGKLNSRVKFVRDVVREVAGFAPYEKRAIELLKIQKDKRCLKFCKKRLGTHSRGKRKRDELIAIQRSMHL